jgi:type IV pilus assembly protein PilO
MPDLRQTRKKIKSALGILLGIDLVALIVLVSPMVGSTGARRQELNQLWSELQLKTRQVEPLRNLPDRVKIASKQITDFYEKRFPEHESQILTEFGKLASAEGVTISQVKYKAGEVGTGNLQPVEMEADLGGNYIALAKFINSLERDQMFFIINSITLGGEQQGPVKLNMKVETYLKAGTR